MDATLVLTISMFTDMYNGSRRLFIKITTIDSQQSAVEDLQDPVLWILASMINYSARSTAYLQ
jgi:hypothetical protein